MFFEIAVKSVDKDGVLINNTNPIMVCLLAVDIFRAIECKFPILKMALEKIRAMLVSDLVLVIDNQEPYLIEMMLKQTNECGLTALDLI